MTKDTTIDNIPPAIAVAGPEACAAWAEFVAAEGLKASTRKLYRNRGRHFLAWLEPQGIGLAAVTRATVESYLDSQATCAHERAVYGTPLRRLFAVLVAHHAIPSNSFQGAAPHAATEDPPQPSRKPRRWTLAQLKRFVREMALDPLEEDDEDFSAALVLLAALRLGNRDLGALSRLTKVPLPLVEEFAGHLRANGVWQTNGKTHHEWDAEDGVLAFWLDVWVATGMLKREPADDRVKPGEPPASDAAASAPGEPTPTGSERP